MTNNPYISFIVAARNDNYGGNFLHRVQIFSNTLLKLLGKYNLRAELIIVEWNPPQDKKRLKEALTWLKLSKFRQVRFIEVPNKIHKRFSNSDKMPMFEYIAKNVGIRRARGEYILATNPDLVFNEKLIQFLSYKKLSHNCFYRLNRYDVGKKIPTNLSIKERLNFCENHWFLKNTIIGSIKKNPSFFDYLSYVHSFIVRFRAKLLNGPLPKIYTNTAGDFLLMARSCWYKLRGYPELTTYSFIDGYMCFIAASLGLSQIILDKKMKIYHQKHTRPISSRPFTDYQVFRERSKQMMESKKPWITNDENWGLNKINLKEYQL